MIDLDALDREVAEEVFGWAELCPGTWQPCEAVTQVDEFGNEMQSGHAWLRCSDCHKIIYVEAPPYAHRAKDHPSYSRGIWPAWQIVEALEAEGWSLELSARGAPRGGWIARFVKSGVGRKTAKGLTAPEAIARAGLAIRRMAVNEDGGS